MRNQGYEVISKAMISKTKGCVVGVRPNGPERFVCWYLNIENDEPVFRQGFYSDNIDDVRNEYLTRLKKINNYEFFEG